MSSQYSTIALWLFIGVILYYFFKGRAFLKKRPEEILETFMDVIQVDPACASITPSILLAKYNGDLVRLSSHLDSIGATPEMVADMKNLPKLATILKHHGLITCP